MVHNYMYLKDKGLQSVEKIMEKTGTWTISYFCPLPPLNNVETQCAKFASSFVIGSKHCIRGVRGFLNKLFKISITFCHWLSEIHTKKERSGIEPNFSNNWHFI